MDIISQILDNNDLTGKEKIDKISSLLTQNLFDVNQYCDFAQGTKGTVKANLIEALAHATIANPGIGNVYCLQFLASTLLCK